jgi:hypothetical protein
VCAALKAHLVYFSRFYFADVLLSRQGADSMLGTWRSRLIGRGAINYAWRCDMIKKVCLSLMMVAALCSCGEKDDEDTAESAAAGNPGAGEDPGAVGPELPELGSGNEVMAYALNALSSSMTGAINVQAASLALNDDPVHTKYALCSKYGEAYLADGSGRMNGTESGYSERSIFCTLNVDDSAETIIGSLAGAKKVLCTLEANVNEAISYEENGKVYEIANLSMPASCGWSEEEIAEMSGQSLSAELTATAYSSGDWQKSLHVLLPAAGVDFKLYYTVNEGVVAIRRQEGWTQEERCSRDASSCNSDGDLIPNSASGVRGDVLSIDLNTGTLRAEITDNYWGRRARALIKGTLAEQTGSFVSVDEISFLNSSIYVVEHEGTRYVSGKFASAKGTVAGGIAYNGGQIKCGEGSCRLEDLTEATLFGPGMECSVTDGCEGNSGFEFDFGSEDVKEFVFLGAQFDNFSGSRSQNEAYLGSAGVPKFETVAFGATIE